VIKGLSVGKPRQSLEGRGLAMSKSDVRAGLELTDELTSKGCSNEPSYGLKYDWSMQFGKAVYVHYQ